MGAAAKTSVLTEGFTGRVGALGMGGDAGISIRTAGGGGATRSAVTSRRYACGKASLGLASIRGNETKRGLGRSEAGAGGPIRGTEIQQLAGATKRGTGIGATASRIRSRA